MEGLRNIANRGAALAILIICAVLIVHTDILPQSITVSPTFILGFLLLASYCVGYVFGLIGLPRITGYILAGFFLGPSVFRFFEPNTLLDLDFINSLALAFIAFCAGGELQLASIKPKLPVILKLTGGITIVTFVGVALAVFSISSFIPFLCEQEPIARLALAALFGVISTARSPSSTIAVISETKAKGEYTTAVLSVTILSDVIVIILFGITLSVSQSLVGFTESLDIIFTFEIALEIIIALICGFALGKGVIFLVEKLKIEFPIVIMAVGFS